MRAHLDALGVPYVINPRMVRGLDYYTKTTFEFVHDGLGAQSGIGGGGRYDALMGQLGGQDLSGIGFGLGVDRTLLALRAEGVDPAPAARVEVFGVPLGAAAKLELARLAALPDGAEHDLEVEMTHVTADIIFRTIFSEPGRTMLQAAQISASARAPARAIRSQRSSSFSSIRY